MYTVQEQVLWGKPHKGTVNHRLANTNAFTFLLGDAVATPEIPLRGSLFGKSTVACQKRLFLYHAGNLNSTFWKSTLIFMIHSFVFMIEKKKEKDRESGNELLSWVLPCTPI